MLETIQKQLCTLYALSSGHNVSSFLIDFSTLENHLPNSHNLNPQTDEQLLLHVHEDETVDLGLYLKKEILENLKGREKPHQQNFSDFCSLVEGVSHFVFFQHRLNLNLPLSQVELELQAEVDKFITNFLYRFFLDHPSDTTHCAKELHGQIFRDFTLCQSLDDSQKERYETANVQAARLCLQIIKRFLQNTPNWNGLLKFLRTFYRQGWDRKFSTITAQAI